MTSNRRRFIKQSLLAATAMQLGAGVSSAVGQSMAGNAKKYRKIATEEGYTAPALLEENLRFLQGPLFEKTGYAGMAQYYGVDRLKNDWQVKSDNLGKERIAVMDEYGIDMQLLQVSSSWIQLIDAKAGTECAQKANDYLAQAVDNYPSRFAGLGAVAPQNPAGAVKEVERVMNELGLSGIVLQSNVQGQYLDEDPFLPIFEAAEDLKAPIYLHPGFPSPGMVDPMIKYGLMGPMFGFATEAALNALRLIMSGLFDRHPGLSIVLGHLGEGIPYFLDRIDTHYAMTRERQNPPLQNKPSDYFRQHFYVTSSGMNFEEPVLFCHKVLGADRVLYAIDYPYEQMAPNANVLDNMPLPEADMELFYHGNAERVFNLNRS